MDSAALKKAGVGVTVGGVISAGALFGVLDNRYALASDIQDLTSMIYEDRVDELEFKIDEIERREANIRLVPKEQRPEWAKNELLQLENRKERYIRKLDRLLGEE